MSSSVTRAAIAANVRAELARRGHRPADLARLFGFSRTAASNRLSGAQDFTATEIVQIAAWLDMPVGELLSARTEAAAA